MPTAQITVLYVNPPKPGKKKGTIKTDTLGLVGCWPNQLLWFQRGQVYTIEYEDDGRYKNVQKVLGNGGGAAPQQTFAPQGALTPPQQASYAETRRYPQQQNKPDSKAIFMTGVVQQAMGSGQFKATDIVALAVNASTAWDQAMGQPAAPPRDDVPPPRGEADYGRDENEPPF